MCTFQTIHNISYLRVRFKPVDHQLVPDRLAGLKALDTNYCQTTNPLIARPLSGRVLTVLGIKMRLF